MIYPEVQAPSDHFDQMRECPQIYEEVPISDRTSTAHSFDSESGMYAQQPQDSAGSETAQSSDDLCAESVEAKKANLKKWRQKHRCCSWALIFLAVIFMSCACIHLLFPPPLHKMMKHDGRGPHDRQAPPMMNEGPHHRFQDEERFDERHGRKGGRHLRRDGKGDRRPEHDEEFFGMKKPKFADDLDDFFPKMKFKGDKMHQGPGHHEMQGGEYHVDKRVLQERRINKMMTRAAFVSFIMWLFIAISAAIGLRAAR